MKEELFKKAMEYLQSAEAFVSKEVPAFVSELLEFKIVEHLVAYFDDIFILGITFILSVIMGIIVYIKCFKGKEAKDVSEDIIGVLAACTSVAAFSLIFTLIGIVQTDHLMQAYKAYKAPRVYLLDYMKDQIKEK